MRTHLDLGPLTAEEFLAFEEMSETRHEFVAGRVYPVAATTARHNAIVQNVLVRLRSAGRGGPCVTYFVNLLVRTTQDRIYYPDCVVVCSPHSGDTVVFDEPCVIVEVTSRSTRRIDRGEKLDAYLAMPSLRGYFVVEQNRRHVTAYTRDASGTWKRDESMAAGSIHVPCVNATLSLDEVYEGVDLPLRVREDDGFEADELALEDLLPEEYEPY